MAYLTPLEDLTGLIASRLKVLRQEQGWSLDKTAAATGVSKAMLGQIERGESSPTMVTLWKIASGFNVSLSTLLDNQQSETAEVIKVAGSSFGEQRIGMTAKTLFPFDPQMGFEFFVIELEPGAEHVSIAHREGVVEHVICIEGTVEVLVNGLWQPIEKGEAIRFGADSEHGYRNQTAGSAVFHNVIHYPAS
ncbi:helix-turn-helix domain-containing protein [Pokkaliibacter sp. CJK22405]|uniref:helix-turn-helix domain-containing protein n=1 Tax=Pokkaliibacter sp. CJK22405 TaxID=3384615 RepID=UPI0039853ABF